MKKKYLVPELEIQYNLYDIISMSMGEGDSIWDNETPLVPFTPLD